MYTLILSLLFGAVGLGMIVFLITLSVHYSHGRRKQGEFPEPLTTIAKESGYWSIIVHFETRLPRREAITKCIESLRENMDDST